MIAFAEAGREQAVKSAIRKAGGEVVEVKISTEGAKAE
jgi:hypothetical protein